MQEESFTANKKAIWKILGWMFLFEHITSWSNIAWSGFHSTGPFRGLFRNEVQAIIFSTVATVLWSAVKISSQGINHARNVILSHFDKWINNGFDLTLPTM